MELRVCANNSATWSETCPAKQVVLGMAYYSVFLDQVIVVTGVFSGNLCHVI